MRKAEQLLWDAMRRNAPLFWWLQRIENAAGVGMPDVHCTSPSGSCAWVELKSAKLPKRPTTPVLGGDGLRVAQCGWHARAASLGVRSFILVRTSSDLRLHLVPSAFALCLNSLNLAELEGASCAASWSEVFTQLSSK